MPSLLNNYFTACGLNVHSYNENFIDLRCIESNLLHCLCSPAGLLPAWITTLYPSDTIWSSALLNTWTSWLYLCKILCRSSIISHFNLLIFAQCCSTSVYSLPKDTCINLWDLFGNGKMIPLYDWLTVHGSSTKLCHLKVSIVCSHIL